MPSHSTKELIFIRHAPSLPSGFLYGQTDADCADIMPQTAQALAKQFQDCDAIYASPAIRCQKTLRSILPDCTPITVPALWEQSFGAWEGLAYQDLPDIGTLPSDELVQFTPPEGESFQALCQRISKAILKILEEESATKIGFFVHAGVIRAVLAMSFNNPQAALKCEINTLSLTKIRRLSDTDFSVICVNNSM